MKLKRPLRGSETGADVRMVQRALNRWAGGAEIPEDGKYGMRTTDRMMGFQLAEKISPARGDFGQASLDKLWPYFDRYGKWRYRTFKVPSAKTAADIAFDKLTVAMCQMNEKSAGYLLGGGHGVSLEQVRYDQLLDCSSSTSKALYEAGLFSDDRAWVSGQLESWGLPGTGKYFTVYANSTHVFIRLHKTRWWRFDTSPHADNRPTENPRRGPRLRFFPRFTFGFAARHYPEM